MNCDENPSRDHLVRTHQVRRRRQQQRRRRRSLALSPSPLRLVAPPESARRLRGPALRGNALAPSCTGGASVLVAPLPRRRWAACSQEERHTATPTPSPRRPRQRRPPQCHLHPDCHQRWPLARRLLLARHRGISKPSGRSVALGWNFHYFSSS